MKDESGELLCVTEEALEMWTEELARPPIHTSFIDEVWAEMEQMSHVDIYKDEVRAQIARADLPAISPLPNRSFHDPGPVRLVRLDCPEHAVIQTLVGDAAEDSLRHSAPNHDAVLTHFRQQHGARLFCLEADSMLFDVERCPADHAAVRRLFWEHFLYCDGEQDMDIEKVLSDHCSFSGQWSFWWD
ncbi:MAG: DUF4253 domain-containing protein [Polyangiaceae bacterium]|nr:DUF4253 domain-containing protein [Polyangiaceae bacterium]